jgi:DNA-binding transcriptional ArsR family regulator
MEVKQRYVTKFLVEEGVKRLEIMDRLNKHYGQAFQRTQVSYWIKEVKTRRKDLSNILPPGWVPNERLDNCNGKPLKEDPRLSTRKIAKALSITSTTVGNHLTQSWGMKYRVFHPDMNISMLAE